MTRSVVLAPTDPFAELCLHGLAHVPLTDAGSSWAPDYLAWAGAAGLGDARAIEDGACIARVVGADGRTLLHAWPRLHRGLDGFDRTRVRALVELRDADVDDPRLLAAIQRAGDPALELMHSLLGLALPDWRRVYASEIAGALADVCRELAPLFDSACVRVPSLAGHRVELAWTLGPRGRAHPERIIVGAPAPWHEGAPAQSVVLALHEHAVRDLASGDYATVEWSALRRVSAWLVDAPRPLAGAHAEWLGRLDLRGLVESLRARGSIDAVTAAALLDAPDERAHRLAALADG